MRMLPTLAVAFGLGLVLIYFGAIGVFGLFDSEQAGGSGAIEGEVNKTVEQADNSSVDPDESTGFLSYVGSAINTVGTFVTIYAFLPGALENVGFPSAFASLIGRAIQLISVLGLLQIAIQWEVR